MPKKPTDFQNATAKRILDIFKSGQKRVLLADEVGLGKTVVASKVIELVGEWHQSPEINDDHFKVVYVCSNVTIANQNAQTLGVRDTLDVSESRLSMQHLSIYQKAGKNHDYKQLIPLTPSTSFAMTHGCGDKLERALLYVHLKRMEPFSGYEDELKRFMKMRAEKDWDSHVHNYENAVMDCDANGSHYISQMQSALKKAFSCKDNRDVIPSVKKMLNGRGDYFTKEGKILVNRIRKIFAEISLEKMNPDLVIMDEFQKFRDLIDESDGDSEKNMLVKKFFDNPNMKILLLSATPYKPFCTLEELNENNVDEQYKDFFKVMGFLHSEGKENSNFGEFRKIWKDYSTNLSQLNSENFAILKASKNVAQDALYNVMCRTERISTGLIDDSRALEVPIDIGDILSYNQMQCIMDMSLDKDLGKKNKSFAHSYKVPVEYVKSVPYVLSFADGYDLKKHLFEKSFSEDDSPLLNFVQKNRKYLITYNNIINYKEIKSNNARLEYLKKLLFNEKRTEYLLWVPASHPYYNNVGGIFEVNKDFSKVLVFSSWGMVPRMLATMLSYEAERLTEGKLGKRTYEGRRGAKYGFQSEEGKYIVQFVSPKLADLYNPEKHYGKDLKDVLSAVRGKVNELLEGLSVEYELERHGRNSTVAMRKLLDLIEGVASDDEESVINAIPAFADEILTNMAIASPAICLYRLFRKQSSMEDAIQMARECASEFVTMFNHRESAAAIDQVYNRRDDRYFMYVLDYCVKGNLQAVLDEYAYMIDKSGEQLKKAMCSGFVGGESKLSIDTYSKDGRKPLNVRIHYALSYANVKLDEKSVNRNINVQNVFNSPFRPFVLASTSVGQEGLDFHKYARRIMHWNLPPNPVELEQREGRINRYKNLAVRRNVAHMYKDIFDWDEMFEAAQRDYKGTDCDMVPYWYLPESMLTDMKSRGIPVEKIERIVAMYPMSRDRNKYERLIKMLSLYRLTMGQEGQEDLLDMLSGMLDDSQANDLMMNLSPIRRR